jgi:hypothetical protein
MKEFEAQVKKWGNSFGITIPKDVVRQAKIRENEKVKLLLMEKPGDLSKMFGSLKSWKINPQKLKDELREEWNK